MTGATLCSSPSGPTGTVQTSAYAAAQASLVVERPARVIISHYEITEWESEGTMTGPNTGVPNTFWHYNDHIIYDANLSVATNGGWQDKYHGTWDIISIYPHSQPTPPDKWHFEWTQVGVTPTNGLIPPIPFTDLASWQSSVVHYAGGDYFWYDHPPDADGKFTRNLVYSGSQTSLKLYSGGRSAVGGRGLIQLRVVNANRYESSPSNAVWEAPWWGTKIIPITNWSRTWLKTDRVGPEGIVWKAMPDNATADVTFRAPYQHYSAEVVPEKFKANITLTTSTTNANLAYDVPEVCVGQKVTFALTNLPMSQIQNIVGTWKLPQKYVNKAVAYSPTCMNYVRNDNMLRNTNTTSCWFVNGTGGPVSVGLNLLFTNGTSLSVAAKGEFTVVKPTTLGMTHSCDGVVMATNANGTVDVITCKKMLFEISVKRPDHFEGEAYFTQIIKRDASWDVAPFGFSDGDTTYGDFWLDTEEEYGTSLKKFVFFGSTGNPSSSIHGIILDDSPEVGGNVQSRISCEDDFNTFLRFKPDGNNNIPITIGVIYWGWRGNANRHIIPFYDIWSDWSFSGSYYGPNFAASEDHFPLWIKTYKGSKN